MWNRYRQATSIPASLLDKYVPDFNVIWSGQWFEIHNPTTTDFDLEGLRVVGATETEEFTIESSLILPAGGFVVLGASPPGDIGQNDGLPTNYVYPALQFSLSNTADSIRIFNGTTLLDEVTYDSAAGFPVVTGAAASLDPLSFNFSDNDNPANWCAASTVYGVDYGNLGSPGWLNLSCP